MNREIRTRTLEEIQDFVKSGREKRKKYGNYYLTAKNKKQCDKVNREADNIICLILGHKWIRSMDEPIWCKRCKKWWCFF